MMEAAWDEDIPFSVEETNKFIDLLNNTIHEGRTDGGAESPEPSREQVRNQSRGEDQTLSKTWRKVTKSSGEMCRIIRDLSHRLYNCCVQEPNFCELLVMLVLHCCGCMKWSCKLFVVTPGCILRFVNQTRLASLLSRFTKRNLRRNNRMFYRTDLDETQILIEGEQPQGTV